MIEVEYAPTFLKQLKKCEIALQDEVKEKINLFKDKKNHQQLRVHKLHGPFAGKLSFSVNYRYRIVFKWLSSNAAALLAIGDHSIYG